MKSLAAVMAPSLKYVAPCAGAWIEMRHLPMSTPFRARRPLRGGVD